MKFIQISGRRAWSIVGLALLVPFTCTQFAYFLLPAFRGALSQDFLFGINELPAIRVSIHILVWVPVIAFALIVVNIYLLANVFRAPVRLHAEELIFVITFAFLAGLFAGFCSGAILGTVDFLFRGVFFDSWFVSGFVVVFSFVVSVICLSAFTASDRCISRL